jgi:hypothetical protein
VRYPANTDLRSANFNAPVVTPQFGGINNISDKALFPQSVRPMNTQQQTPGPGRRHHLLFYVCTAIKPGLLITPKPVS